MKKVLLYKTDLLNISETFIREQILSYEQWTATLVGKRKVPGLPLADLNVRILAASDTGRVSELKARVLKRLQWADPRTVRQLREEAADLVHVHFGTEAVEFWPNVRSLKLPMVVTLHGYDITMSKAFWENCSERPRYPRQLIAMSKNPQVHFIAVSEAIKKSAVDYGIPEHRIHVQYIGIDVSKFKAEGPPLAQRKRRILFVGRLVEKKGIAFLLEAFARVRSRVTDAELTIVGDGPLKKQLQAHAARLEIPVDFAGAMGADGIKQQLNAARVFCLPSITAENGDAEGFGLVILEAQACGVPVVTSAKGGAQEGIIEGQTGFSFAEKDVDTLTRQLQTLLTDDPRATRMSEAAPRFVKDVFDLRLCTRSLERVYDRILRTPAQA